MCVSSKGNSNNNNNGKNNKMRLPTTHPPLREGRRDDWPIIPAALNATNVHQRKDTSMTVPYPLSRVEVSAGLLSTRWAKIYLTRDSMLTRLL